MRASLALLATAAVVASTAAYSFTTDADCEYLGTCTPSSHQCQCHQGFTGPSCGTLDLAPTSVDIDALPLWPNRDVLLNNSAWGFTIVHDPSDNLYHAFVTVACGSMGVVGDGGGDSWIAHVSSPYPDHGFTLQAMVVPQTSFGPHLAVNPATGQFVLIFRVNLFANTQLCGGNSTQPVPGLGDNPYIPYSAITPGDPENGTNMFIAWADKMTGPWTTVKVNITEAGGSHKSNPSITFLKDGRVMMAYRYNSKIGELNAIAFAVNNDFRGPYATVFNLTNGQPGDEDPFVWEQPDGTLHLVWHNKNYGYHGFAVDNNGKGGGKWQVSPIVGTHAFNLTAPLSNGTSFALLRRERPEIRFDPSTGAPVMLYNGVTGPWGAAWVLGQPFAGTGGGAV